MTKCVFVVLQNEVENRKLISESQIGVVRNTLSAKEQALLNLSINKKYTHKLHTVWIDVKKAFDSVDHEYLIRCIECLKLRKWIELFIKKIVENWRIMLLYNAEEILQKKIKRGILQGDSLSPLLFVLCLEPLSRILNQKFPVLSLETSSKQLYPVNHLMFIDDIKIFATEECWLKEMSNETNNFLKIIGLDINFLKSTTNSKACEEYYNKFDYLNGYKYLGIVEGADGSQLKKKH